MKIEYWDCPVCQDEVFMKKADLARLGKLVALNGKCRATCKKCGTTLLFESGKAPVQVMEKG